MSPRGAQAVVFKSSLASRQDCAASAFFSLFLIVLWLWDTQAGCSRSSAKAGWGCALCGLGVSVPSPLPSQRFVSGEIFADGLGPMKELLAPSGRSARYGAITDKERALSLRSASSRGCPGALRAAGIQGMCLVKAINNARQGLIEKSAWLQSGFC